MVTTGDHKLGWTSWIWTWASKNYNRLYKEGNFLNISGRQRENFSLKHWVIDWWHWYQAKIEFVPPRHQELISGIAQLSGPCLNIRKDVFSYDLVKSRSREICFRIVRSLWNLTGTLAALLLMCLSNFIAIRQFKVPISWLRDFTRSYEKTSFRILRRGPGVCALFSILPQFYVPFDVKNRGKKRIMYL